MKVVLFGATGMVGSGVLKACLDDPRVQTVVAPVRGPSAVAHPKLKGITHSDFFDLEPLARELAGCDACFFCLGVSAAGMSEARYHRLTYDLTIRAAETVLQGAPGAVFCYVSGAGTYTSEQGRFMWARVKGKTENRLLAMPFRAAYMFRPGYIQPMRGVRSKTGWYQAFYSVVGPLYPLLRRLLPGLVTTSETLGRAMIQVAAAGYPRRILEVRDINLLGAGERARHGAPKPEAGA